MAGVVDLVLRLIGRSTQTKPSSFAIRLRVDEADGEPPGLVAELVVAGQLLSEDDSGPVDLVALEQSTAIDGTYFIWTCTCGDPGCGGRFKGVDVRRRDGIAYWYDRDAKMRFAFDSAEVDSELAKARVLARQLFDQMTSLEWTPTNNELFIQS